MKVAIIGGGISGLSTAYYIKKLALPVSEIIIYESSAKLGGWIDSKKINYGDEEVCFEKGPRTLRIATGELKELNSLQMAQDLGIEQNIDLIPKSHPASKNRYLFANNKLTSISTPPWKKNELVPNRLISYLWNEFRAPRRSADVKDESIWDFIARRFGPDIADNFVDPLLKGICGGDVKKLSAASLLKVFYDAELTHGSVVKKMMSRKKDAATLALENQFADLVKLREHFNPKELSVWKVDSGMSTLVDKLSERLSKDGSVRFMMKESVEKLEFQKTDNNQIKIQSNNSVENVDLVISSIYSKYLSDMLSSDHTKLKDLLNQIECVNMVIVNLFYKKNVLPVQGFGYLVPTKTKSPVLGCIFDSVFNKPDQHSSTLTAMLGGAWYNEYIGNKTNDQIYDMAFKELRSHLNLTTDPDLQEVTVLKDAIPQYKVGHQQLLENIHKSIAEAGLANKLFLTGNTVTDGIGVNDCIFNSRKLVENVIAKEFR